MVMDVQRIWSVSTGGHNSRLRAVVVLSRLGIYKSKNSEDATSFLSKNWSSGYLPLFTHRFFFFKYTSRRQLIV